MPRPVDLTNRRFGRLVAVRLLKKRGKFGERRWLCRCDCGRQARPTAHCLLSGHTTSCGCARATVGTKRILDLTGKRFGALKVLGLAQERSADGRTCWRAQCLRRVRGKPCGRVVTVRGHDLKQGRTKSCGQHYHKGPLTKGMVKIPPRLRRDGELWILPKVAARQMGVARHTATKRARNNPWGANIRRRLFPTGLGGALVRYMAERDVFATADESTARRELPAVPGHLPLGESARQLNRSPIRVREVAREEFGKRLPTYLGKDAKGRAREHPYVPLALHEKLKAYFAAAPQKQLEGLSRRRNGHVPADLSPPPTAAPIARNRGRARSANLGSAPELTKVEAAIQVFLRDPNQSVRAVARAVRCNPSLLFNDARFARLRQAHAGTVPSGRKAKDGAMEAEADH